jgi:hypothetical protein
MRLTCPADDVLMATPGTVMTCSADPPCAQLQRNPDRHHLSRIAEIAWLFRRLDEEILQRGLVVPGPAARRSWESVTVWMACHDEFNPKLCHARHGHERSARLCRREGTGFRHPMDRREFRRRGFGIALPTARLPRVLPFVFLRLIGNTGVGPSLLFHDRLTRCDANMRLDGRRHMMGNVHWTIPGSGCAARSRRRSVEASCSVSNERVWLIKP